jgi:hypothetical protein
MGEEGRGGDDSDLNIKARFVQRKGSSSRGYQGRELPGLLDADRVHLPIASHEDSASSGEGSSGRLLPLRGRWGSQAQDRYFTA